MEDALRYLVRDENENLLSLTAFLALIVEGYGSLSTPRLC